MKRIISVISLLVLVPAAASAACRISDLQKCLDSACYDGLDPASRCYTCGTSAAKKPAAPTYSLGEAPKMQGLSLGKSSSNTISDKELKSAPDDPGDRYKWATSTCIKKLTDCKAEDVTDNYDTLVQQSCKIALGESNYLDVIKTDAQKKTTEQCNAEINNCLLSANKCGSNMLKCEQDSDFNNNFSACAADATGCGDFISAIHDKTFATRNDMVSKNNSMLSDLVKLHQMERQEKLNSAKKLCQNGGKDSCVLEMCGNMPNGISNGSCADSDEKILATNLCKFVDIACDKLK